MVCDEGPAGLDLELRFSDADRTVIARASILDCLAADLRVAGCRYIAYDGDFYRVEATLLERLDAAVAAVPVVDADLPCYNGGTEALWNTSVAHGNPGRFALLDGQLIHLPGVTPFEACDLMDVTGALIHVKRKARSSSMSHLFVQAEKSCQLLRDMQS